MNDCIFCKIINKEIPSNVVYEDDEILAFNDIVPKSPVHILVIPKDHIETFNDIKDHEITSKISKVIQKIVIEHKIDKSGYRVVINCNKDGGQIVNHLHYHILGGKHLKW